MDETFGRLTIKIFVAIECDEHGRERGTWRTLFNKYLDKNEVPATIAKFSDLNTQFQRGRIDVAFTTTTHYNY